MFTDATKGHSAGLSKNKTLHPESRKSFCQVRIPSSNRDGEKMNQSAEKHVLGTRKKKNTSLTGTPFD